MKTDNELIAEFMGFYITSDRIGVDGKPDRAWKSNDHPYFGGFRAVHLQRFESDWSWLMPVVEKIATYVYDSYESSNGYKNITEHDRAYTRTFGMIDGQGKWMVRINRMPLEQEDTLIKATYQAVVEFIKWYNTQPKEATSQQQSQSE